MGMQKDDLSRSLFLDVTKDGAVFVRMRGTAADAGLPVFSVDTRKEGETLIVRHCRLARDGSGIYRLNDPPEDVDDLGRVSDLFRATYAAMKTKATKAANRAARRGRRGN